MAKRYQEKTWLREQYVGQGKTLTEIASECDVTATTIGQWMERHGIDRRGHKEAQKPDKPYTDEGWLRREYVDNKRAMSAIADECDVSAAVILKWLRRFDIPTRSANEHQKTSPAGYQTMPHGYELATSKLNGDVSRVYIHQLVAIADGADPHKVFSKGKWHCHHKNSIRWDNRHGNIEFKRGEEHMREHSGERVRTETGEWE